METCVFCFTEDENCMRCTSCRILCCYDCSKVNPINGDPICKLCKEGKDALIKELRGGK
ncbi:hypothetical protein LCGC14_2416660 [marine sediment metagenome]|uniref:B box-type domain-containing protein n=1 Tax=marine sediment metagenome TaxID=412755 RepID=A0A0F9BQY4_9ZZZZ